MPPIGRELSPGHRLVSASMLPDSDMSCPHCGSKDFTLLGFFKRSFEQVYTDGKAVKESITLGEHPLQTYEGILCKACSIHTIIEDDNIFEREMLIFDLQMQLVTLQGKVAVPATKEWVN